MTASLSGAAAAAADWPVQTTVPAAWLFDHARPAVRARAVLDLARVGDPTVVTNIAYTHAPALRLALAQRRDGTWNGAMLTTAAPDDPQFRGVGTVPAVRRLLEYGWGPESPPVACARRLLFRLLAEDADPAYLYELRQQAGADEERIRGGRLILREAAAATLAQMGLERDPRLRGAATRLLDRVAGYLRSIEGAERALGSLPPGAAPPSTHLLTMLAFMPIFRAERQYDVDRILAYLSEPIPSGGTRQQIAGRAAAGPHLVFGDPIAGRDALKKELPTTLAWLETFARLGFLRRNDAWGRLLDQLLETRDTHGVWKRAVSAGSGAADPFVWPTFPLSEPDDPATWPADVTFRLALIARLAGRRVEVV